MQPSFIGSPTENFANKVESTYACDALNRLSQVDHAISITDTFLTSTSCQVATNPDLLRGSGLFQ